MATSVISNTIVDLNGTPLAGVNVVARLRPSPSYRVSDSATIASMERTVSNSSGVWSLTLERNADVVPGGSWYEVTEELPVSSGGNRTTAITVGAANVTLRGAEITATPASPAIGTALTQAQADARYAAIGSVLTQAQADARYAPMGAAHNVTDYGAVGDGITDDTAAFTIAVAAATAGDTLYIPQGRWKGNITLTKPMHIRGDGKPYFDRAAGILVSGTVINGFINLGGQVGASVRDIGADSTGLSSTITNGILSGFSVTGTSLYHDFINVAALGRGYTGGVGPGNSHHGISAEIGHNIRIDNVHIYRFAHGIALKGSYSTISNCYIEDTDLSALIVKSDAHTVEHVTITNVVANSVSANMRSRLVIQSSTPVYEMRHVAVTNFTSYNSNYLGVFVSQDVTGAGACRYISITNAQVRNAGVYSFMVNSNNAGLCSDVTFVNCVSDSPSVAAFQNQGGSLRLRILGGISRGNPNHTLGTWDYAQINEGFPNMSANQVALIGSGGAFTQDSLLPFDITNKRLGVNVTAPVQALDIGGHGNFTPVSAPGAPTVAVNPTAGNLTGAYTYRLTFVSARGETNLGTTSASVSPSSQQIDLTNIPLGPTGTTQRRIFRTKAGGAAWFLVTALNDNTTTTYTDNATDASITEEHTNRDNTTAGRWFTDGVQVAYVGTANNVAFGRDALALAPGSGGSLNTGIGRNSGRSITTGAGNVGVGTYTMDKITTGGHNVALGYAALFSAVTSITNVAIGSQALLNVTSSDNTGVGGFALYAPNNNAAFATTTGARQTAIGHGTGQASATQRNDIVCVGYRALCDGNNATAIGANTLAGAAGSVAIGKDSAGTGASTTTQDEIKLGTALHAVTAIGTFRLPHRSAPSSPVDGDMWTTSAGLFVRINGTTRTVAFV